MKRLLELPADDRLTARAHTLVKAVGPTIESEARLLRVRRALDAPKPQASPRWALRLALATGLLGASAAAAAGTGMLSTVLGTWEAPTPSQSVVAPAVTRPKALGLQRTQSKAELLGEPSVDPLPPALPRAPSPHLAPSATSDVARVHEAAKALRHDGDPSRALQLLGSKPISGPLAEEALALRIEASMARADGRQGKLAAAYLSRYPQGRYKDVAQKALAGHAP